VVIIIKLRSGLECNTFTRKQQNLTEYEREIKTAVLPFGTAKRWEYEIGNKNLFTQ
jgi:hypothetical protein